LIYTLPPFGSLLGACRLSFDAFLRLLYLVAEKKGAPLGEVAAAVAGLQQRGPALSRATTPEAVRLHDDRSSYTGGWGAVDGVRATSVWVGQLALLAHNLQACIQRTHCGPHHPHHWACNP